MGHANNDESLRQSVKNNDTRMAEILVSHGADVTVFRNEPLRNAVDKRNFDMVKLLVKAGAELQSTHNYALRKAVGYNDIETAEFLLNEGANINDIKRWNSVSEEMMVVLDKFGGDPRYRDDNKKKRKLA